MSLKDVFGQSAEKTKDGIWIEVAETESGATTRFKIRPMGTANKEFVRTAARKSKTQRGASTDLIAKTNREIFCDSVLVDWENVEDFGDGSKRDEDGNLPLLEFNRENAIWLMRELPNLYELLVQEAQDISNFQESQREETAKNLSSGFPTGAK